MDTASSRRGRTQPWVRWSGFGAVVGTVVWAAMPWLQQATLGTRPYVATGFDVGSLVSRRLAVDV